MLLSAAAPIVLGVAVHRTCGILKDLRRCSALKSVRRCGALECFCTSRHSHYVFLSKRRLCKEFSVCSAVERRCCSWGWKSSVKCGHLLRQLDTPPWASLICIFFFQLAAGKVYFIVRCCGLYYRMHDTNVIIQWHVSVWNKKMYVCTNTIHFVLYPRLVTPECCVLLWLDKFESI